MSAENDSNHSFAQAQSDGETYTEISSNMRSTLVQGTPVQSPLNSEVDSKSYDDTEPPRRFITMADIIKNTEPIELDEELLLMGIDEPTSYKQANKDMEWGKAMIQEMKSIERNKTWHLTELPKGHKAIGLKWIYKLKRDANGKINKYKARLVAKGYVQEQGVDFDEIFAPVTRIETVRLLLALAAWNSWRVHHLDVKTAFLNGEIHE